MKFGVCLIVQCLFEKAVYNIGWQSTVATWAQRNGVIWCTKIRLLGSVIINIDFTNLNKQFADLY